MRNNWLDCRNYKHSNYHFSSTSLPDLPWGLLSMKLYLPQGKRMWFFSLSLSHIINISSVLLWFSSYFTWNIHESIHSYLCVITSVESLVKMQIVKWRKLLNSNWLLCEESWLRLFAWGFACTFSKNQELLLKRWKTTCERNACF